MDDFGDDRGGLVVWWGEDADVDVGEKRPEADVEMREGESGGKV